jgi:hypothetical protein
MFKYNESKLERKSDCARVDDGADFDLAVLLIASRFNLAPNVARLVVERAGLGVSGD